MFHHFNGSFLTLTWTDGRVPTNYTINLLNGTSFYLSVTDGKPGIFTYELFAYILLDTPTPRLVAEYYTAGESYI